jgi:glc operon protein GlcG
VVLCFYFTLTLKRPPSSAEDRAFRIVGRARDVPQMTPMSLPALTPTTSRRRTDEAPVRSPSLVISGKPLLTLEAADAMASGAIAEAKRRKFKDISVFVLDASGRILVSKTMLNCPLLIPQIAHGKAGATIGTHSPSRALKDKYVPDRTPQLLAMTTLAGNSNLPFCAVPGGVLCRDHSNNVLGAIGVSGASADEDEHCAIVGAQSVGCVTEPARSPL